jgi:hypothetical protein
VAKNAALFAAASVPAPGILVKKTRQACIEADHALAKLASPLKSAKFGRTDIRGRPAVNAGDLKPDRRD